MKILLGLLLSLYVGACWSEIYKWVDEQGLVHYSDEPEGSAKPITPPEISIFKFRIPKSTSDETIDDDIPPPASEVMDYRIFEIARPSNNETFHSLPARLDVEFSLQPVLQKGHYIELSFDGQPVAGPIVSAQKRISGFSAGSHILSARILADDGRELARTKSVLFHYQPTEAAGDSVPPTDTSRPLAP
jgi:hypothetical protein